MRLLLLLLASTFTATITQNFVDGLNAEFGLAVTVPTGAIVAKAVFDCGGAQLNGWPRGWTAGGYPTKTPLRMGMGNFSTVTDCHYAAAGTYTATLTVTRANGAKLVQSSVVTVGANP